MNHLFERRKQKLHIVNEAQRGGGKLRMEIVRAINDKPTVRLLQEHRHDAGHRITRITLR